MNRLYNQPAERAWNQYSSLRASAQAEHQEIVVHPQEKTKAALALEKIATIELPEEGLKKEIDYQEAKEDDRKVLAQRYNTLTLLRASQELPEPAPKVVSRPHSQLRQKRGDLESLKLQNLLQKNSR